MGKNKNATVVPVHEPNNLALVYSNNFIFDMIFAMKTDDEQANIAYAWKNSKFIQNDDLVGEQAQLCRKMHKKASDDVLNFHQTESAQKLLLYLLHQKCIDLQRSPDDLTININTEEYALLCYPEISEMVGRQRTKALNHFEEKLEITIQKLRCIDVVTAGHTYVERFPVVTRYRKYKNRHKIELDLDVTFNKLLNQSNLRMYVPKLAFCLSSNKDAIMFRVLSALIYKYSMATNIQNGTNQTIRVETIIERLPPREEATHSWRETVYGSMVKALNLLIDMQYLNSWEFKDENSNNTKTEFSDFNDFSSAILYFEPTPEHELACSK